MLIFLDTEFSDLREPYLISIGLVARDCRELYLEIAGVHPSICSEFVKCEVLPLLQGHSCVPSQIADRIKEFLAPYRSEIVFFCDAPSYDMELLKPFLPANLKPRYIVPSFETETDEQIFLDAQKRAYAAGLRRHHSLDDAKSAAYAWRVVTSRKCSS